MCNVGPTVYASHTQVFISIIVYKEKYTYYDDFYEAGRKTRVMFQVCVWGVMGHRRLIDAAPHENQSSH